MDFLGDVDDALDDDILLGDDLLGWDDLGDVDDIGDDLVGDDDFDELGARGRRRRPARGRGGSIRQKAAAKRQARAAAAAEVLEGSAVAGVPSRQAVVEPLGFTVVTFTAASGTTLQATAQPQKKMKGSRLVIEEVRSATATGLVTLSSLKIGTTEVLLSAQPVPAGAFRANAFGVALRLVEAGPGIIITATFVISAAPVMAETVTISTMLNCLSMA